MQGRRIWLIKAQTKVSDHRRFMARWETQHRMRIDVVIDIRTTVASKNWLKIYLDLIYEFKVSV